MAANPLPDSYVSLLIQLSNAYQGAKDIGAGIPLLINTEELIRVDRLAVITAQAEFKAARSGLVPLSAARQAAMAAAYDFCFTAWCVLQFYCGRRFNESWLAAGWTDSMETPESYEGLYALTLSLVGYLTENPGRQNEPLGVTAAHAQELVDDLAAADYAVLEQQSLALGRRQERDKKFKAGRKRISGLCKELSQRLEDMDPRWHQFGFNLPGAATVPLVPEVVVVTALPGARLQISCEPSPNATRYRFYLQRPEVDAEPVFNGSSVQPLFVTEGLAAGQQYLIYVSAVNEGAESGLSAPVSATTRLAAAA